VTFSVPLSSAALDSKARSLPLDAPIFPYGGAGGLTLIQRKSVAHSHGNQCLSSDACEAPSQSASFKVQIGHRDR
jgi:hypothetical protein